MKNQREEAQLSRMRDEFDQRNFGFACQTAMGKVKIVYYSQFRWNKNACRTHPNM